MNLKKHLAGTLSFVILAASVPSGPVSAGNAEKTPGCQLQTILIDNNGTNLWTTESWGGANILPNTSWTTTDASDYYYNGVLTFEAKSNADAPLSFWIGLSSRRHVETVSLYWTDLETYKGKMIAGTDWTDYSLPVKDLLDANPDSGFDLSNLWKICISAVKKGETVSFRNVKLSSPDDERQYPFIKVNQVGYSTAGAKTARISCFAKFGSLDGKTYEIVDKQSGETVLAGTLPDAVLNDHLSGESVHIIRFDELTTPGTYFIRVPDAGLSAEARSPRDIADGLQTDTLTSFSFRIGDRVYDDLLRDLTKYYYYQRQGLDLDQKYAGDFARKNLHPDDLHVRKWSDRDNPDAEVFDVSQGWYDAGDYGKYTSPAATTIENLLLAYDLYPQVFQNMQLQIPETDPENAAYVDAPGYLSEIKWEIDMLLKLEHADRDGSFYVAANYKDGTIYLEDTLKTPSTFETPAECDLRSHLATAEMAAMLAHAYLIYRDVPAYAVFAETCLVTALRAWNWVNDESNEQHPSIGAANRTYTFSQEELDRSTYWAAGALCRAVKAAGKDYAPYESYLLSHCETENVVKCFTGASVGYNSHGRSFLGFFHYLYRNEDADPKMTEVFGKFSAWRRRTLNYDNWGPDFPDWGYWWGSNMVIAQSTMTVMLGSLLTEGEEDLPEEVVLSNESAFNYLLGINPISFSYVSGYGENSVRNIYSAIYSNNAKLDPYKCPAGYTAEGTDYYDNRQLSKYDGKCYMDSDAEWTTNENTIYGNAAMIFLTASVVSRIRTGLLHGDVDCSGNVRIADAVLLARYLAEDTVEVTAQGKVNAECDGDDSLTTGDLAALLQYLAGTRASLG